jgi:hypothetical protein
MCGYPTTGMQPCQFRRTLRERTARFGERNARDTA